MTKICQNEAEAHFVRKTDNKNKIACIKWYGNKAATLVSSFNSAEPLGTVKRFDKSQRTSINVSCPNIVRQYDVHMGGVDQMDGMLISLYRITMKGRKWYLSIFAQVLDISINNAWLMYRKNRKIQSLPPNEEMCLKDFRYEIAKFLKMKDRVKRKRNSAETLHSPRYVIKRPVVARPRTDVCNDKYHFPIYSSKGRCRYCSTRATH